MKKQIIVICLSLISFISQLSAKDISGVVYDATMNEPVIGATVKLGKGSKMQATDIDGHFLFKDAPEAGQLTVSYIGSKTQIVSYKGSDSELKIVLQEESHVLDQVVVIGYGVQKKSDLTGSVSTIGNESLKSVPTTNVAQALQGRAAGVEVVQNSGAPGSSTSIRIRGMGTVNNSDPLYVVDGIPMENINYLSADDIQSMEILKDATSASIYGSRAANGVVLITTKSGKDSNKKVKINFNSYWGFQQPWKQPSHLNKVDYAKFADFVKNQYVYTKDNNGALEINPDYQAYIDGGNDWWDLVSRDGFMSKYSLAFSGGDKKLNYYLSGNYQSTDGIIKQSDYDKLSVNLKVNTKPVESVSLGMNVMYSHQNADKVLEGSWGVVKSSINYNPLTPIYDINDSYTQGTPLEVLRRCTNKSYTNNLIGQISLDWDILKSLHFSTRASYTRQNSDVDEFTRYNTNPEVVANIHTSVGRNPITQQNFSWDNILTFNKEINDHNLSLMVGQTMETSRYENVSATGISYGGYDDYFDALNLATMSQSVSGYTSAWSSLSFLGRLSYNYKGKYLLQSNFRADASSKFHKNNRWGFFPSVSAGWKITGEDFMEDLRGTISLLKLRAGWGQLGNNRIGNYAYQTLVASAGQYIYGIGSPSLVPAMAISQYGNENIKWERTQSTTVGLDLNMFNNRIKSSVEWFTKDTKDMLIAIPLVYSAGYSSNLLQNAGSVRNSGVEVQISYNNKVGDFSYEVGGNITFNKNKVLSLGTSNEPILGGNLTAPNNLGYVNRTVQGSPIGCFYGYKTDGIMKSTDFDANGNPLVPVFATSTKFQEGDMKFVDVNRDGKIDENDQTFLGSPHPDFYYGFNINLGYKGFDLQMFFQGVAGNQIYNAMKYFQYSGVTSGAGFSSTSSNYSNVAADYFDKVYRPVPNASNPTYRDRWGANVNGTVPTMSSDDSRNASNFRNSDFYVEDGDYLRLKSLQLSYTFDKSICSKLRLNNLRVFVSSSNLFTITKYSGLDPEIGKRTGTESNNLFLGIDEGSYPQSRTFTGGFSLDF